MADLKIKKVLMVSEEDAEAMELLAGLNTSGNESELLRRLLRMAMYEPRKFGLVLTPANFVSALAVEVA